MQIRTWFFTLIICLIAILAIFPIYWIITCSVRPYAAIYTTRFEIIPSEISFDSFRWVLFDSKFFTWLKNTLIVYLITIIVSLSVVCPSAYAFSRFKFFGKNSLLSSYFILCNISGGLGVMGLVALYVFLLRLYMANSLLVLGLIYAASNVPFNTWYLKTYFDSIPKEFDEAALMDGASLIKTLRYTILPVAIPGIMTSIIFMTIGVWGEWIVAATLLGSENYTLAAGLATLLVGFETPWNKFAAASILYAIPAVLIFTIAHRSLKAGLTLGGVKG